MSNNHLVFVYGSLLSGLYNNNSFLKDAQFMGKHITEPLFTMISFGGYPGVFNKGDTRIVGEVYEVDGLTLSRLDYLEGTPTFYRHHNIPTPYGDAIMYVLANTYDDIALRPHIDGDWRKFLEEGKEYA